jgi:hypothetical protein
VIIPLPRVRTPDSESDVCQQADDQSAPAPKDLPIYISWYINEYRRPWTSSDMNLKIRHAHEQIAGPKGVLHPTTDQMVTSHVLSAD